MATTYSANVRLQKPTASDRQWDLPINANVDALDAMTALGALAVTMTETPSATLQVRVSPGSFVRGDRTVGQFTGTTTLPVLASATTYLWLDPTGVLVSGPAFPTSPHLRLARVVAGVNSVQQVIDERVQCAVAGSGSGFVLKSGDTIAGTLTIAAPGSGSTSPLLPVAVVDPVNRLLGFFGSDPASQAPKLSPVTAASGSVAGDALVDVGASFAQSTLNNNFATLAAKVDALIAALQRHGLMAS